MSATLYSVQGDGYVLWSAGPDGKSDTDDDIVADMSPGDSEEKE